MTAQQVECVIQTLPFATIESPFIEEGDLLVGSVGILDSGMPSSLVFRTEIHKAYPLKFLGQETIRFINPSLIDYPHIMEGGFLCFHASNGMNEEERLYSDLNQLYMWVDKYYLRRIKDEKYEHVVVSAGQVDNSYYALHFTQTDIEPKVGEYGYAFTSNLKAGIHKGKIVHNLLLQFIGEAHNKNIENCLWSQSYKRYEHKPCIYCMLDNLPAQYNKFALKNYVELNSVLSMDQRKFIHMFEKSNCKKMAGEVVPLLLGYRIPEGKTHWQALMLKVGEFPIYGMPQWRDGKKTGMWYTMFRDGSIEWAMTFDSSYDNFFGRGRFCNKMAEKNILVIGVGAVGSMVARTLVKCGCKNLSLCDFDLKKPENVCRSEYSFLNGACDKVYELADMLSEESPHVNINVITDELESKLKLTIQDEQSVRNLSQELSEYDFIFDCTTDDDTMMILEGLNLSNTIVNLSITNHAKELVCGLSPNISNFVKTAFRVILSSGSTDLYEPTGCWSPTFKASYNDIASMVQYAMKHIHRMINGDEERANFILRDSESGLKIVKY